MTGKALLKTTTGPFYDSWENASNTARAQVQRERLVDIVTFAKQSTRFYASRLNEFKKTEEHPLANVPILNSSDLREHLPPKGTGLVSSSTEDYTVFQSGGTTGFPKTTLFSHEELEALNALNARGFFAVGLKETDRVANMFAVGGLYMTFIHINRMLQQYGCMNFPFSNHTPADFVGTVTQLFNINCFTGIASVVLDCLRKIHESGVRDLKIEKVFYGGEHMYDADKLELRNKFGTEIIAAPGYGTVESWYIGYQCDKSPTGVFHAHDDQCYLEILNEDTGKHCGPEEVGLLVVTPFARRLTPIIRYKVGDRAKFLKDLCPCGRTTPVFKLLGRGDDVLRIGYDSVDYNFIQDVAMRSGLVLGSIQMEKKREDGKDCLILRFETDAPKEKFESIAKHLREQITNERPSLREFIAKGTVKPLVVEIYPANSIPKNPRTGKLIRVIDAIKDA